MRLASPRGTALAVVLLSAPLAPQVPDGHYVAGFTGISNQGGLAVLDHRPSNQPLARITGLSGELTSWGPFGVAIRHDDGALLVGEYGPPGTQIDLHVLTLSGFAVASAFKIPVGVVDGRLAVTGRVEHIRTLPNGDALISVWGLTQQGPLQGNHLGIVSLASRTVRPLPVAGYVASVSALDVDASRSVAYFAEYLDQRMYTGPAGRIHAVSLSGGVARQIATFAQDLVSALVVHDNGLLYLSTENAIIGVARPPALWSLDPVTGTLQQLAVTQDKVFALNVERATGDLLFGLVGNTAPPQVYRMSPGAIPTKLTTLPGSVADIDVAHDPLAYGRSTPALNAYAWQATPNPGGLPQIGNASFGLRVAAQPSVLPVAGRDDSMDLSGVLLASTAPGSLTILGVELLLGTTGLVHVGDVPPDGRIPLPIPLDNSIVGTSIYFQSLHLGAGGLAASNGLRMTVLQ